MRRVRRRIRLDHARPRTREGSAGAGARRRLRRSGLDPPPLAPRRPEPPQAVAVAHRRRGHDDGGLHGRGVEWQARAEADRASPQCGAAALGGHTEPAGPGLRRERSPRGVGADAHQRLQRRSGTDLRRRGAAAARGGTGGLQPNLQTDRTAAGRRAHRFPAGGSRADPRRAGARRQNAQPRRARIHPETHRIQRTAVQGARHERANGRRRPRSRGARCKQLVRTTMVKKLIVSLIALSTIALTPAFGDWPTKEKDKAKEKEEARVEREQDRYEAATDALDDHEWRRAVTLFTEVARMRGPHADAAIYWAAYAKAKNGDRTDALATLLELQKAFPQSKYIEDAKSLEVEIRQNAGEAVSPEHESDDDVKLMAITGLLNSDPDRAIPILQGILRSPSQSAKMKDRALFVLSQTNSPRAAEVLTSIAKDGSNRGLQSHALKYLGVMGSENGRKI